MHEDANGPGIGPRPTMLPTVSFTVEEVKWQDGIAEKSIVRPNRLLAGISER